MSESPFRASLVRRVGQRMFYGWVIVWVAMLGIFASGPAQSHTFSVFIGPIAAELGLSQTAMASAYGLATLVAAFCLPLMGRFLDRVGARRMLAVVALVFGAGCAAFGLAGGMIWLALGFAALRFLGQGSLMLGSSNMVSQWFSQRRGFALGLMALGFAISMAVHPTVAKWLIDLVGWREAWLWLGISTWVLLLPPVLFFVVSKPEDVGLRPDGFSSLAHTGERQAVNKEQDENDFTLSEALRTPTFYIVAAGLFTLSMLVTTLHFFQVSIFSDQGLDTEVATIAFAVSAVTMIAMMPTLGRMLDRFPTERMFAGGLLVVATTLVIAAQISGIASAVLYALAFGVANAVSMTYYTFMWPQYFGRTHLGSIQGTGQMIGVVGASLGPLPLGFAKDYFGNYDAMLVGLAVIPLTWAVVAALFLRQPVKLKPL
jgi:MFS family permease